MKMQQRTRNAGKYAQQMNTLQYSDMSDNGQRKIFSPHPESFSCVGLKADEKLQGGSDELRELTWR